jgi:exonuclease III
LSKNLTKKIKSVEIGKYHDWIKYSDHVPMIINLDHFD